MYPPARLGILEQTRAELLEQRLIEEMVLELGKVGYRLTVLGTQRAQEVG